MGAGGMSGHEIKISVSNDRLIEGLQRAPEVIERNVDAATGRGAQETAREMVATLIRNRSMARTKLALSILSGISKLGPSHYRVSPGSDYARAVEEGTGPAAGQKAYMPNPVHLRDYVKQRAGINFKGKPGTPTRRQAMDEIRDRAWALAMYIKRFGTRAHPFVKPTREKMQPRVLELVLGAVQKSLQQIFGTPGGASA